MAPGVVTDHSRADSATGGAVAELSPDQWLAQAHRYAQLPETISLRDWAILARHIAPGKARQEFLDLFRSVLPRYGINALLDALPDLQSVDLLNAIQETVAGSADAAVLAALLARCTTEGPEGDRAAFLGVLRHLRNEAVTESLTNAAETARHQGDPELARAAWDGLSLIGNLQACGFLFQEMKHSDRGDRSPPDESLAEAISRVINPDALPLLQAMARGLDLGAPVESRIAAIRALGNYELTQVEDTLTVITATETDSAILESVWVTRERLTPSTAPAPEPDTDGN